MGPNLFGVVTWEKFGFDVWAYCAQIVYELNRLSTNVGLTILNNWDQFVRAHLIEFKVLVLLALENVELFEPVLRARQLQYEQYCASVGIDVVPPNHELILGGPRVLSWLAKFALTHF